MKFVKLVGFFLMHSKFKIAGRMLIIFLYQSTIFCNFCFIDWKYMLIIMIIKSLTSLSKIQKMKRNDRNSEKERKEERFDLIGNLAHDNCEKYYNYIRLIFNV